MWWIVLLMIFAIGLIIKNYNRSNIITKHKYNRNHTKMYGCDYEHNGHDWNGNKWYDAYNIKSG